MVVYNQHGFLKHMSDVQKNDISLTSFNEQWDQIRLLCEINCPEQAKHILPNMTNIQTSFFQLQQELINALIAEKLYKVEQKIASKAQVAVDILIRNLYERTADIGFLATDDEVCRFASLSERTETDTSFMIERLKEYVSKYSVYDEVIILDTNGKVLVNLDQNNPIVGKTIQDELIGETLSSTKGFLESFRHSPLQEERKRSHIFSSRILKSGSSEIAGIICLCFRFENEMEGIFPTLSTDYDGSVIMIIDQKNRVITSSDEAFVPGGTKMEELTPNEHCIIYYRGLEFIAKAMPTKGYQGYNGIGWKGYIMIPLNLAFKDNCTKTIRKLDDTVQDRLMRKADSFSQPLHEIVEKTHRVNNLLKRVVYNGQLISENTDYGNEYAKLKPILNTVSKIGSKTRDLFEDSIRNLFATVITANMRDAEFLASLGIDIMDRNLYERANDCRWWALNPTFKQILGKTQLDEDDKKKLTSILSYINRLYTVYSNLVLFDRDGVITAVSNPDYSEYVGKKLTDAFVRKILNNTAAEKYVVSDFIPHDLYDNAYTYLYGASVTSGGQTVGGIFIVFDSEFQFQAMLDDCVQETVNCFAVFAERGGMVISSNNPDITVGSHLKIPNRLFEIPNGKTHSEIVSYNGCYYAVGCACSSSYREYKKSDGYQNDVICLVFNKLADIDDDFSSKVRESIIEQPYLSYAEREGFLKYAVFSVGNEYFALPKKNVLAAANASEVVPIPSSHEATSGVIRYQDQYVAVLNTHALFGDACYAEKSTHVLILQTPDGDVIGLEADDLNNVLEISKTNVTPAPKIGQKASLINGILRIDEDSSKFIMLIDPQMLISRIDCKVWEDNLSEILSQKEALA